MIPQVELHVTYVTNQLSEFCIDLVIKFEFLEAMLESRAVYGSCGLRIYS